MTDPTAARRLLRHAYQELIVCVVVWLLAMVWTLGVYVGLGYRFDAEHPLVASGWVRHPQTAIPVILGFPDWVFWGIIVPWILITAFTVVYTLYWMPDDDLGVDVEPPHDVDLPDVGPTTAPSLAPRDSTNLTTRDTVAEKTQP